MSVKIIVDSASDIKYSYALEKGIGFAPLKTNLGGVEYKDGIDIHPEEFYEKLEANKELAHTSQVNASEFMTLFEEAVNAGDEVVVITMSSGLSGTYQSAVVAASDYEGKVYVVDSLSATAGSQVLIQRAIELRDQGKTAAEIYADLDEIRKRYRLFVRLETLEYLKRGGRISKTSAMLGGLMGIKPILTLNTEGKLETVGKARGIKMSHKMMNDSVIACGGIDFNYPVVVTYAGDVNDAAVKDYISDSAEIFHGNEDKLIIGQLGCVIGTHTGPGAIVISFVPNKL
jgi:DegV family protein with EDD domain